MKNVHVLSIESMQKAFGSMVAIKFMVIFCGVRQTPQNVTISALRIVSSLLFQMIHRIA